MLFTELDLHPDIQAGLADAEFVTCTMVQERTLPASLAGEDVAVQAQTGTGKTACFLLTIFQRLLDRPKSVKPGKTRALVVAPTRELAVQINNDAVLLGKYTGLSTLTVFGGTGFQEQRERIHEGLDLVIGTPGRLIDYIKRRDLDLRECDIAVIDEADRLFDMGFIQDLRFLMGKLPRKDERQSMLFSATLNYTVMELAYAYMNNPLEVAVEAEQVLVDQVDEVLYHVGRRDKFNLLLGLLEAEKAQRSIIFCNRKIDVERVVHRLKGNGYEVGSLSGDLPQSARLKVIAQYKKGELPILVATDVAGRGLHIDDVTHVFNYDVPQDAEDYVHRIGRTARAGAFGRAITLACEEFVYHLPAVEKYIGHKVPVGTLSDDLFAEDRSPPFSRSRRGPKRRSEGPNTRGKVPPGRGRGRQDDKGGGQRTAAADQKRTAAADQSSRREGQEPGRGSHRRRRRNRKKPDEPS
jgi:ATP-dependent RNA helicase RhlB